jgi:hypothetical protein
MSKSRRRSQIMERIMIKSTSPIRIQYAALLCAFSPDLNPDLDLDPALGLSPLPSPVL